MYKSCHNLACGESGPKNEVYQKSSVRSEEVHRQYLCMQMMLDVADEDCSTFYIFCI